MKRFTSRKRALLFAVPLAALAGGSAIANHSWSTYAWNYDGANPIAAPVVDNTDPNWTSYVDKAVADWNASPVIQATIERGNNSSCSFVTGTIQVCNDDYGSNGWLGLASIALSGGKIVAGTTKLNDNYFNRDAYNTYSWRQLVTCQEIGHDYGLAHQNENFSTDETTSCMEYTSRPEGNEGPDQHDYDQLLTIYSGGGDGGGGGTKPGKGGGKGGGGGGGNGKGKNRVSLPAVGNTPATWGRPTGFLLNGRPHTFEKSVNGIKFVTHVTWAPEEGGHDDHHH
ncbi:hypothetical protein [Erythrobacter sp. HKB08]|uniref:hypothetical protein n=1 Tax=Erythrobacter sp. HKB08 TaxID=2502843 RepID=UPI0010092F8D|nr:hypothetical protein [Erythrobacter sp. HKB08]